ncbi:MULTISPECIES: porin family protein [unclassified Psychrobacter]|uniref:porin family protein n=1 Tax=unclassified Psychrobacter TaxID=196806 RepID=UPI00078EA1B6|nr:MULTISPECIES: porin family protein [unclassified Psychrobacter]AMN50739.1 cell envelope biogenesis protein OmpA [Psychrobacter sp. P2G3]AMN68639.1 cell envelope biogenesis protein OmpA [Psychrobacter sp. P11G5]
MKALQKTLLALVAGSLMSVSAQAAVNYAGQPYVGVKVGKFLVDTDDLDDPTAYGVYAGYNFDSNFGAEVEYVGSSDTDIDTGTSIVKAEYDLKTYGAYGTYRYQFPNTGLYAKGKLGFAKAEIDASLSDNFGNSISESDSDSGLAGGIGLGYNFNPNMSIETEYAYVAEDITLLTLGANLKF